MRILILLLLLSISSQAQITYVGGASVPADNGTSSGASPVVLSSGLGSMPSAALGDLVVVYVYARNASATFGVSATGGQTWTAETALGSSAGVLSGQVFWCRFNGTWTGSPSFTFSSTTSTSIVAQIFRPTNNTKLWALDVGSGVFFNTLRQFTAASSVTVGSAFGSYTTANTSTVTMFFTNTDDDNTWSLTTAGSFTSVASAQYRNLAGSDASSAYIYHVGTSAGEVLGSFGLGTDPTLTEATLGNDGGLVGLYTWYEYTPVSNPRRRYRINQP
jgi:hypothetical protein